jgi:AAA15 family ATPase/GTPase
MFLPAGRNITVSYPEQFQLLFYGELKYPTMQMKEINTIDINLIKTFVSYSKFLADYFSSPREDDSAFSITLSHIIYQILHGDYKNENGFEKIMFNEGEYVPLNVASSGQQECIRLIQDSMYIYQEEIEASRIIEEPEAHLFPRAQQILIDLLLLIANKTKSQVILTTHSSHVLAEFNNLLYCAKLLKEHPEKKHDVEMLYGINSLDSSKREWLCLDSAQFQAYSLKVGSNKYCESILDDETNLIGTNLIDESSDKISDNFDNLYRMM